MTNSDWGRDITFDEMSTARWDHVVAAASGNGWCKQMIVSICGGEVSYRIWFGSCLVIDTSDLQRAVMAYNAAGYLAANSEPDVVPD